MTATLLDTSVLIVIILSILISLFRGFVREMLMIVNLIGAAIAARYIAPMMLPSFQNWVSAGRKPAEKIFGAVPQDAMAMFLANACVFFGVFLILSLAGMAISGGVKALGLGPIDRILGIAFGALRGFLIVFLIYAPFAFAMSPESFPVWVKESTTYTVMNAAYQKADAYMKDVKLPESREMEQMAKDAAEKNAGIVWDKDNNAGAEQQAIDGQPLNRDLLSDERAE